MKARTFFTLVLVAGLAAAAGYQAALHTMKPTPVQTATEARKIKFYQSPMHPWIKSDQPGKCTICGMTLMPVYEGEAGVSTDPSLVTLAASSASVIGVQTAEIRRAPLVRTLRVAGIIDDDESRHRYLSAYTDARIEKLYVHTTGVEVAAGEPLAVLYSPELLTARQEFHSLARTNSTLLGAAREKLIRLGLLEQQIDALALASEVSRETEILAPLSGTVVARSETAYAGGYVKAGDMLFAIGDFKQMWFVFDAYEPDLPALRIGQTVEISVPSLAGQTLSAPITFIDPNLNEMTRTAKVRVVLENTDRRLRHRITATGRVTLETPETLIAPRSAVLHTQREPMAYVELGDRTYEPRSLKLGRTGDDAVEILDGLAPGEKVVTQGALLIDGQAQLAHSANGNDSPPPAPHDHAAPAPTAIPSNNQPLFQTSAEAAAALSADDLAAYAKLLPALTAAVHQSGEAHETLMPLAAALVPGPDLTTARAPFEAFSSAVADLARALPVEQRGGLRIFQCPMAPVTRKARWLQHDDAVRNPFFGSAMLECGNELK